MTRFVLCAGALGFALVGCTAPVPPDEGGASREAEAARPAPGESRQEAEGAEPPAFRGHTKHIDFVAFAADFGKLVTVANDSGDRTGRVWDVPTGRELCRFALPAENGDYGAVSGLWFTADGAKVVTDGYATRARPRAVRTWDAQTGRLLRERADLDDETRPPATGHPPRDDGRVPAFVVSTDGKRELEGGRLFDLTTGRPLMWATGQRVLFATGGAFPESYDHLLPGPDGVNVALTGSALSADGSRALFRELRTKTKTLPAVQDGVHPTMPIPVTEWAGEALVLLDTEKGQELKRTPLERGSYLLCCFRDGRPFALVWDKDGTTLTLRELFP